MEVPQGPGFSLKDSAGTYRLQGTTAAPTELELQGAAARVEVNSL